ncbi:MAG: ABC transporter permease [bacterium]|nr:ABC transporter permease [bacterium]
MEEFIASTLRSSVPLAYAGVGCLFAIRAGIFHLGIEGLMLSSAFAAVGIAHETDSVLLAVAGALVVSAALSVVYWATIDLLHADSIIAGLGLTTLSVGGAAFLLDVIFDQRGRLDSGVGLPRPIKGAQAGISSLVTDLSILGWFAPLFVLLYWLVLRRTAFGLRITAVGSYSYGARAAGIRESRIRLHAMLCTSVGSSLAGVELALGGLRAFSEDLTGGRGFIALAAALFGQLNPIGTAFAALFFGSANAIGVVTQIHSVDVLPRPFILMTPFVITILFLTLSAIATRRAARLRRERIVAES